MTLVDPTRRLTPVVRLAPAKLNLTLAVVGRRPDGYHALHSVMAPLALADRLSLAPDPSPDARDRLRVDGFDTGPDADNLVLRALDATRRALRPHLAVPPPALAIRLEKRIPVAAGLAGGSSDAAAAIEGALEAWGAGVLSAAERSGLAASIGSDVPFFLAGGPALVEGRGERVTPLRGLRPHAAERRPASSSSRPRSRPTPLRSSPPGRTARWASRAWRRGARSTSRRSSDRG